MVTWICMHALEFNRLHLPRLVVCLRESLRQASVHVVNCLKNLMINNYFYVICANKVNQSKTTNCSSQVVHPNISQTLSYRHAVNEYCYYPENVVKGQANAQLAEHKT